MADLSSSQLGVTSFMSGLNSSASEETLLDPERKLQSLPAAASASMPDLSIMTPRPQSSRFSPVKPLSLREYEQQLSDLRKENFNLKLRIYFLEEQLKEHLKVAGEDVHKLNVELRIEVERLKEDLEAKQDLLLRFRESVQTLQRNKQIDINEAIEEERNRRVSVEEDLKRANDHINSLDGQMEAASQRIVELELLNSQLQFGGQQRDSGDIQSRPTSGDENLPAFESDSEMQDISTCLLTGKEKQIMDLKANLVYQEQEWHRVQAVYDERIRLLQSELDTKTEVIRQLNFNENRERLCKSCQSSPIPSARQNQGGPYQQDLSNFSMLNGADITSGPIMMNSQMSLLGHISTGPYNITSQGSALYDAIASDAEEKLTNLQDLCAEKEMKILELTGLLEARQFELDHLRCELEQSKETIAELEGQIKMQFKSPRSKQTLERRDTGTGSGSSMEGESDGPYDQSSIPEAQHLEEEIRQAESVNAAFQSLIESQKTPNNASLPPFTPESSNGFPPSSTVETLRARLDHLSRSNEHLRKSLQVATSTPETVPQISHFLAEWELLNKSVEHSENLNRILIDKFADIMGRAMTEAPSLQNVFGRHKLFDDADFSQSPFVSHSRSQQRLTTPRVTFIPQVDAREKEMDQSNIDNHSENRQANLKSIMKPLNFNIAGGSGQKTPASHHRFPQCDGTGGLDISEHPDWNSPAGVTPSLSFSRYIDPSLQDLESLRLKLDDNQSAYFLLRSKLEGTVVFLKQLLAMLGASPEFSQYSEHLEQVVRELTESLVVTTNIVEAYDGVKSGLLELSSHFYSNMSGSALLEHSRLRSVSKFSSPENESSWAQHQSPATGKSVSRVQTENQNPNVADGTDNQQLENAIAEKSAEIFRLNEEISDYRFKVADYEVEMARLKKLVAETECKANNLAESKIKLSSEVEDYKLKKSRYETQIEELKALLTEAEERCKDVIDVRESFKSDVEQSRKEAAEYKSKLSSYESQVMGLRASLQESQARSKLLAESEKRLNKETEDLKSKLTICEKQVSGIKASLKAAQNECRILTEQQQKRETKSIGITASQDCMTDQLVQQSTEPMSLDYWKKRSEKLERYAKNLKMKISEGHRSLPTLRANSSDVATSTDTATDQSVKSRSVDIEPIVRQIRDNNEELGKKVDIHDNWKKEQKTLVTNLTAKIEQLEKQLIERQDKYEVLKREYLKLKGFCQGKDVEIKALRDRTNCVTRTTVRSGDELVATTVTGYPKNEGEIQLLSSSLDTLIEKFHVIVKELKVLGQHASKHGDTKVSSDGCISFATEMQCCIGGVVTGLGKHLENLKSTRDMSVEMERELEQMSAALAEMRQQMSSQEGVLQNMSNRLQTGSTSDFDKAAFEKLILKELVQTQRYLRKAKEIMEAKRSRKLRKANKMEVMGQGRTAEQHLHMS